MSKEKIIISILNECGDSSLPSTLKHLIQEVEKRLEEHDILFDFFDRKQHLSNQRSVERSLWKAKQKWDNVAIKHQVTRYHGKRNHKRYGNHVFRV